MSCWHPARILEVEREVASERMSAKLESILRPELDQQAAEFLEDG
jgi:hypothetical protein